MMSVTDLAAKIWDLGVWIERVAKDCILDRIHVVA